MINLVQLSKTMAFALRHHPERFGLFLDDEGWVPVDSTKEKVLDFFCDFKQN
jgi:RNA:NAD 2'-phosphotransferase (TPT1/KptA family)